MALPTLTFLGLSRELLTTAVGTLASIAVAVVAIGVLWLALSPLASRDWAATLGVDDFGESGPDPAEVIAGFDEPIAPTTPDDGVEAPDLHAGETGSATSDVPGSEPSA